MYVLNSCLPAYFSGVDARARQHACDYMVMKMRVLGRCRTRLECEVVVS